MCLIESIKPEDFDETATSDGGISGLSCIKSSARIKHSPEKMKYDKNKYLTSDLAYSTELFSWTERVGMRKPRPRPNRLHPTIIEVAKAL